MLNNTFAKCNMLETDYLLIDYLSLMSEIKGFILKGHWGAPPMELLASIRLTFLAAVWLTHPLSGAFAS